MAQRRGKVIVIPCENLFLAASKLMDLSRQPSFERKGTSASRIR